jgi:hypothetical protein
MEILIPLYTTILRFLRLLDPLAIGYCFSEVA